MKRQKKVREYSERKKTKDGRERPKDLGRYIEEEK